MEVKPGGTNAVNQPGPLSSGAEYPVDLAWAAFYSAVWDAYEEVMRKRRSKQTDLQLITDHTEIIPGEE